MFCTRGRRLAEIRNIFIYIRPINPCSGDLLHSLDTKLSFVYDLEHLKLKGKWNNHPGTIM